MANFTYMGTKRALAGVISEACLNNRSGPVLDLFAGLSAVGASIGERRNMWFNDIQHFSNLFCRVMYCDASECAWTSQEAAQFLYHFSQNSEHLGTILQPQLDAEAALDDVDCAQSYLAASKPIRQEAMVSLEGRDRRAVHHLFSMRYAISYIGLRQSVEIDSVRYSLDQLMGSGAITVAKFNHGLLSLCRAVASASNSTGHFAQFLSPNEKNLPRIKAKRRVSILGQFQVAQRELVPQASEAWRSGNRWFNCDALTLLEQLKLAGDGPGVVYADPPYTDDQYSRFYHLLETVILYDYPEISGHGLYRAGRVSSEFSLASRVSDAFKSLIAITSDLGAGLVVSYPANGLLADSFEVIPEMLRTRFSNVFPPVVVDHSHSTLGASKGPHRQKVSELIFVAR